MVQDGTHAQLAAEQGSIYQKVVAEHEKSKAKEDASKQESVADADASVAKIDALAKDTASAGLKRQGTIKTETISAKDVTDKDPVAIAKLVDAEKLRIEYEDQVIENMDDILNPKKQDATFNKEMSKYAKPQGLIIAGCLLSVLVGAAATMFGWFIMEVMTIINIEPLLGNSALDEATPWIGVMAGVSCILFIAKGGAGMTLAIVANNIIKTVREELYENIIRKDIGWHDQRDNSSGIMTSTLASDVQLLNGVSSDGLAIQIEGFSAVLAAIIAGFVFSWPMTLVGLGIIPLIMICGAIVQKADNEAMMGLEEKTTDEDIGDD
jgi:ABC-type bacteriocin/lantibiotic exporter with double-glycine peptidase domain